MKIEKDTSWFATKKMVNFMSHSLLWRHIVLLTVGVYASNNRVLYTIGISITRRFQKSVGPSVCLSVRPSVCLSICPFITLTKKAYSSFIIDSRKNISHFRWKGLAFSTRKWGDICKKTFLKNLKQFFEKFALA